MSQFKVNVTRADPYKNFKFRVKWDGKVVAGVSKVSALKRSTELVTHREANDFITPRISPASSKFEAITLERGMSFAPEFEEWASMVYARDKGPGISLAGFRKDITIELMNLQGTVVRAYTVLRCWVSEYTAMPELDANANAVAFENIVLQNEGFERDDSIVEVAET